MGRFFSAMLCLFNACDDVTADYCSKVADEATASGAAFDVDDEDGAAVDAEDAACTPGPA